MVSVGISIRSIGPITEFEHTMDSPGLHVLKGKHGAGKSITLRTVQLVIDGRTDIRPTKSDGTKRGEATVAGKTLRISTQVREEGDLLCEGLGDLSIADLHSPRYDKAETRDRHRIKALARLAGVGADATLFHDLFGGRERFEKLIEADALKTDDLVEMAARIKRGAEKHALRKEEEERTAQARARAAAEQVEGVDLTAPSDAAELQARLTAAVETRTRVQQQRKDGLAARARADESHAKLVSAKAQQTTTVEQAETVVANCQKSKNEYAGRVRDCERELRMAQELHAAAGKDLSAAEQALAAAYRHAVTIAAWQADIDSAAAIHVPTEEDVAHALLDAQEASAAVSRGVMVRQAIASKRISEEQASLAKDAGKYASRLRDAARDTQDVLSDAIAKVPNCPLKVRADTNGDARLVIATDRSDAEYFDELSDGERWPILIDLGARKNVLMVLPQAAFGELSDKTRDLIDRIARERGCYLLTAAVDDADLRCEPWGASVEAQSGGEPIRVAAAVS
jgi:hypothetical protein